MFALQVGVSSGRIVAVQKRSTQGQVRRRLRLPSWEDNAMYLADTLQVDTFDDTHDEVRGVVVLCQAGAARSLWPPWGAANPLVC